MSQGIQLRAKLTIKAAIIAISFASIVGLLLSGSPPTIIRTVSSVIVDTVKSQSIGTSAHVVKEASERILPSTTNTYSSSTIPFISPMFRIATSSPKIGPCVKLRLKINSKFASVGLTPARSNITALQIVAFDDLSGSTITHTIKSYPISGSYNISGTVQHYKRSKSLPCSISIFHTGYCTKYSVDCQGLKI